MRIIKPSRIREFANEHPSVADALMVWLKVAKNADWTSIRQVREIFPHADAVTVRSGRTVTVFNIGGNKYRLVVAIKYPWSMIYVLRFLDHSTYSRERWKDHL